MIAHTLLYGLLVIFGICALDYVHHRSHRLRVLLAEIATDVKDFFFADVGFRFPWQIIRDNRIARLGLPVARRFPCRAHMFYMLFCFMLVKGRVNYGRWHVWRCRRPRIHDRYIFGRVEMLQQVIIRRDVDNKLLAIKKDRAFIVYRKRWTSKALLSTSLIINSVCE